MWLEICKPKFLSCKEFKVTPAVLSAVALRFVSCAGHTESYQTQAIKTKNKDNKCIESVAEALARSRDEVKRSQILKHVLKKAYQDVMNKYTKKKTTSR